MTTQKETRQTVPILSLANRKVEKRCEEWQLGNGTKLLQDKEVDPSAQQNYAIRFAAQNGHVQIVRLLLQDERVDPSAKCEEALVLAAMKDHEDVVELLLNDHRVDPTVNRNHVIRVAAGCGSLNALDVLLKDARVNPQFALDRAVARCNEEVVVKLLADSRVDPRYDGNSALRLALAAQFTSCARLLLADQRVFATPEQCVELYNDKYARNILYNARRMVLCFAKYRYIRRLHSRKFHITRDWEKRHKASSQVYGTWCLREPYIIIPDALIKEVIQMWTCLAWKHQEAADQFLDDPLYFGGIPFHIG